MCSRGEWGSLGVCFPLPGNLRTHWVQEFRHERVPEDVLDPKIEILTSGFRIYTGFRVYVGSGLRWKSAKAVITVPTNSRIL